MPRAYDRLADFVPLDELDAKLRELHARVAAHAGDMPTHADVIARYCGESAPLRRVACHEHRRPGARHRRPRRARVARGLRHAIRARSGGIARHRGRAARQHGAAADAYATLPALEPLHTRLRIDEGRGCIAATRGAFTLGRHFHRHDGAVRAAFFHAYGSTGARIDEQEFLPHWIKARQHGLAGGIRGLLPDGRGRASTAACCCPMPRSSAAASPTTDITCRRFPMPPGSGSSRCGAA